MEYLFYEPLFWSYLCCQKPQSYNGKRDLIYLMHYTFIVALIIVYQCARNRFVVHACICHKHEVAAKMTMQWLFLLYIPQRSWDTAL